MKEYWENRYKRMASQGSVGVMKWQTEEGYETPFGPIIESVFRLEGIETVLDFGCGVGREHDFLMRATKAKVYYGWDISEYAVIEARKRYPKGLFPWDWKSVSGIDLVFCHFVIQHILDDKEVIETLKGFQKILSGYGQIIIIDNIAKNRSDKITKCRTKIEHEVLFKQAGLTVYRDFDIPVSADRIGFWGLI